MTHIAASVPLDRNGRQYALASEAELDISDYLRDEGDDPPPLGREKTFAALVIGAVGASEVLGLLSLLI